MKERVASDRLAPLSLFSDLSVEELESVAQLAQVLHATTGTVIAEENDLSTKFFVLLRGTVTIHRSGRHVADLGEGDFFGEAGTMTLAPRNATVIATTPVEAAAFMGWDLRRLLEQLPSLKSQLEAANASRAPEV